MSKLQHWKSSLLIERVKRDAIERAGVISLSFSDCVRVCANRRRNQLIADGVNMDQRRRDFACLTLRRDVLI
jgi:hypothetical protein